MHLIPVNKVLELWASGWSLSKIRKTIRDRKGRPFTENGIGRIILVARRMKDPRAIYHRRRK